jgi:hypothetical protein
VAPPQREVDERPEEEKGGAKAHEPQVAPQQGDDRPERQVLAQRPAESERDGEQDGQDGEPGPADPPRLVRREPPREHADQDDEGAETCEADGSNCQPPRSFPHLSDRNSKARHEMTVER